MLPGEQTQECAHESSHMTSSYRAAANIDGHSPAAEYGQPG